MDFLNSRHLTAQDGFLHPFREPGTFTYAAQRSEVDQMAEVGTIVVSAGGGRIGAGTQHDVVFSWDAHSRRFVARKEDLKLAINQHDFVVFHFDLAIPGQPPCFISIRQGERIEADSRRLKTHEAFTHFFLKAGDYAYRVGESTCHLAVADHRKLSRDEHRERAGQPLIILLKGGDPSASKAHVVAGQTVIWAVESGEGLSIESSPRAAGTAG
jgi:hypothetical protein